MARRIQLLEGEPLSTCFRLVQQLKKPELAARLGLDQPAPPAPRAAALVGRGRGGKGRAVAAARGGRGRGR